MSKSRQLVLDGLDAMREELDFMAMALAGWQFRIVAAPVPHGDKDLQIEGYCPELKKHAGIIIREQDVESGVWKAQLTQLRDSLIKIINDS